MLTWILTHQWKEASRSSVWQKSLVLNIIIGLVLLYLFLNLLAIGLFMPEIMTAIAPGQNMVSVFHKFLIYYLATDLILRFFLQDLPVLSVQPYLHLPIRKSRLIHFMLGKSVLSLFNLMPLVVVIPFAVQAVVPAFGVLATALWVLAIFCLLLVNNFLILYLKRQLVLKPIVVLLFAVLLGGLAVLEHQGLVTFTPFAKEAFNSLLRQPALFLVPALLLIGMYGVNYWLLRRNLYLQEAEKANASVSGQQFAFLQKWGEAGSLLALELKLIWRNKRPRSILFMSLFFVPYGLVFYTNENMSPDSVRIIFAGLLITGGCMFQYGQFLHSWEGSYFDALMTKNVNLTQYYRSKFLLLTTMCTIGFLLSVPYVFLGLNFLLMHFVVYLYNIGVNLFFILYLANYNPQKIDLSKGSAFNWQGFGAAQYIMIIPLMVGPVLFYLPFYLLNHSGLGLLALALCGLTGLAFHKALLKKLTGRLMEKKYRMGAGFRAS